MSTNKKEFEFPVFLKGVDDASDKIAKMASELCKYRLVLTKFRTILIVRKIKEWTGKQWID